ncbi:MAG: extradiol dioxygenase [Nitrososphaeria archaeon]|nr:hypothetical protein [Conexivisphaerales archaeon]
MIKQLCLLPHGDEVLNPEDPDVSEIREIMTDCGSRHRGETVIVISPHTIRVPDNISILYSERLCKGDKCYLTDRALADELYHLAKSNGLPVIKVNYGTDSGELSSLPLDWGSEIPLSFFPEARNVVIIGPGREVKNRQLFRFGYLLSELKGDFSVIISADQAHAHSYDGPYGFSFFAKTYDETVKKLVKENQLYKLLYMDRNIVDRAKPDSYWQLLMLAGLLKKVRAEPKRIAYAIKNYFSMLAADYELKI